MDQSQRRTASTTFPAAESARMEARQLRRLRLRIGLTELGTGMSRRILAAVDALPEAATDAQFCQAVEEQLRAAATEEQP